MQENSPFSCLQMIFFVATLVLTTRGVVLFEEYSYIRGSLQSISAIFSFIPTIIVIQTLLYIYIFYIFHH
jgi:hypothetical protein